MGINRCVGPTACLYPGQNRQNMVQTLPTPGKCGRSGEKHVFALHVSLPGVSEGYP